MDTHRTFQCLADLDRGFKRVAQDLPAGFMAYQHPLFEIFKPDLAKTIVPPSSSRAPIAGLTKARLPVRSTAPHLDPFVSNSGMKQETSSGEMGSKKVISQKDKPTEPPVPNTKREPKLPPSVLIASLRWGNKEPFSHYKPGTSTPPSVRIAALRRDNPTNELDHTKPRPSLPSSGPANETKASAIVSKRSVEGKVAGSGSSGFAGCDSTEITCADLPGSMSQPREKRKIDSEMKPSAPKRCSHDDTWQQLETPPLVVSGHAFARNKDDDFRQRLAEKERFLQAMIAERKINRAAAEANRAVYQIANPSGRLSAVEEFAFAEQEQALKRQRIMLETKLALQTHEEQERQRLAEQIVIEEQEMARRQRLAAALYGSGKPQSSKPAAGVAPKRREPEAASRTQHTAETPRQLEPETVTCSEHEAMPASTDALHGSAAFATRAHMDPLLYYQQQRQLQQQQALALNARLAFPLSSFSPGQNAPLYADDATLEHLLLLQRLGRR
jgi:hypothetical protein